jgi:hypothetical protein
MRKIFWANKGKVIVIASVISLLIATKALAWGGAAWAPYAGELVWIYPGEFGPESVAYEMKWSQMALTIMRGWPQTDAILDQTADCTANSPDGNKLSAAWSFTNIPHYSVYSKNDCPWWDPWGPKEEVEMQMKTSNMQADYSYMWTVVWRPERSAASGEINITAQRDQSEWQWLDKTLYSYGSGAAVANFSKISPKSKGVITTTRGFKGWYAYKVVSEGVGRLQAYRNCSSCGLGALTYWLGNAIAEFFSLPGRRCCCRHRSKHGVGTPRHITLYGRGSANTVLEHQEVVVAK